MAIAQVMGLIHDDHVPFAAEDGRAVWFPLGGVQGGDNAVELVPGGAAALAEGRIVVALEIESELAAHFSLPLLNKRRRHQNERRPRQPAQVQLVKDKTRLNGFS